MQTREDLLLAVTTTADLSGTTQAKGGIDAVGAAVANMSDKARAAFEQMSGAEQAAVLNMMGISSATNTTVNEQIGAFLARAKTIDVTSKMAIAAFRAEADALSAELVTLGATDAEINKIGASVAKLEQAGGAAAAGLNPVNEQITKVPRGARTAANALAMMSGAALGGATSFTGMVRAAGAMTYGLATLSESAKVAAAASGIGALVIVLGVVIELMDKAGDSAKATAQELDHLKDFTATGIQSVVEGYHQQADAAQQAVKDAGSVEGIMERIRNSVHKRTPGDPRGAIGEIVDDMKDLFGVSSPAIRALEHINTLNEAAGKSAAKLASDERSRVEKMHDASVVTEHINDLNLRGLDIQYKGMTLDQLHRAQFLNVTETDREKQLKALETARDIEEYRIRQSFVFKDTAHNIVALTAQQTADLAKQLDQNAALTAYKKGQLEIEIAIANTAYRRSTADVLAGMSNKAGDVYQEKEDSIKEQADIDRKKGYNEEDITARTQARIRALRKETAKAAMDDATQITSVLIASGNRQIKAVGHAADTVRRLVIGAQAAHAGVESAIEAGKALGSLATGDFRGAALHAASALSLAKAAALGAQESLGGGNAGGGGSAGGGNGGNGTFSPRTGTEGQGGITINLLTQDPYGRRNIQQVMYEINRAEILGRPPIQVPPTTGVTRAA